MCDRIFNIGKTGLIWTLKILSISAIFSCAVAVVIIGGAISSKFKTGTDIAVIYLLCLGFIFLAAEASMDDANDLVLLKPIKEVLDSNKTCKQLLKKIGNWLLISILIFFISGLAVFAPVLPPIIPNVYIQ